jgi:hypothetical protein
MGTAMTVHDDERARRDYRNRGGTLDVRGCCSPMDALGPMSSLPPLLTKFGFTPAKVLPAAKQQIAPL